MSRLLQLQINNECQVELYKTFTRVGAGRSRGCEKSHKFVSKLFLRLFAFAQFDSNLNTEPFLGE